MIACTAGDFNGKMLENRNTNITKQLSHIYEAFSNFRLVAQIREEIEKVNQINTLKTTIASEFTYWIGNR